MGTQKSADHVKPLRRALTGLLSISLLVALFVFAISFYASLFGGPAWLWVVVWPSVLLAVGGIFLAVTGRVPADSRGLAGTLPWLEVLDMPLHRLGQAIVIAWVVGIPTLFFAQGFFVYGGIESWPVFAPRDEYRLINHSVVTEVSRSRFLIVGIAGTVVLHATFLAAALYPLYTFLFGDRLNLLGGSNGRRENAKQAAAPNRGGV